MRVEQLYPFPAKALITELSRFKKAEMVWCQEEPKNMGAWAFIEPNIEWVLAKINAKHSVRAMPAVRGGGHGDRPDVETQGTAQRLLDEALGE
jgi:2-oxoglutarate dehydrogenase E1 component